MKRIRITLVKSPIGKSLRHRRTIRALGLKKMHSSVIRKDSPQIRGMVAKVSYMVKIDEVKPVKSPKQK